MPIIYIKIVFKLIKIINNIRYIYNMVLYHNRVRNKFNTNNKLLGGGRNLDKMVIWNNNNRYISGSGVGAVSRSNRRALLRNASPCSNYEAQYNILLNRFLDIINGKL